jgi:hypothetical protein
MKRLFSIVAIAFSLTLIAVAVTETNATVDNKETIAADYQCIDVVENIDIESLTFEQRMSVMAHITRNVGKSTMMMNDYDFCVSNQSSNLITCCVIISTGQTLCDSWYPW